MGLNGYSNMTAEEEYGTIDYDCHFLDWETKSKIMKLYKINSAKKNWLWV